MAGANYTARRTPLGAPRRAPARARRPESPGTSPSTTRSRRSAPREAPAPRRRGPSTGSSGGGRPPQPPRGRGGGAGRPRRHWLRGLILSAALLGSLAFLAFAFILARTEVPTPNDVVMSQGTVVFYADGQREIGRLTDSTRRSIPLATVPEHTQFAVLAAEDRDFYEHGGVNPVGIARAALNNVFGNQVQGGSTITQQYAKNAFLSQERSWERKIKEALLAFKLETIVSKEEILQNYLNTSFFGRDAEGIEAAAYAYFGIPASQLTLEQSAVLASILKSPGGLAPESNLEGLQGRFEYVLDAMLDKGWITEEQRNAAQFPEIKKQKAGDRLSGQTGHLLTAVNKQLLALGFTEAEIQRGGMKIVTTFERQAQRAAERAVRTQGPTSKTKGLRIGLAAVKPGSGEVVALYGGQNFIDDQINNATQQFAQAGSTFKPFALAAALDNGVTLGTTWPGASPITIQGYTLTNYADKSYKDLSLLEATQESVNSAYVSMESAVGVDKVAQAAVSAGVPKRTPGMNMKNLDLTFVLGTASPSAVDMANAYATFAFQGIASKTTFIKQVMGPNDGLLWEFETEPNRVFSREVANTVTYALEKTVNNGTAAVARELRRPAAAKTGTTDDNKSAWFVGYTPQLSAAVLMAKEIDGRPVSLSGTGGLKTVTGGSYPAKIWTAFMAAALKGQPEEKFAGPAKDLLRAPDCPAVLSPDLEEVPPGCPVPELIEDFSPDEFADNGFPVDEIVVVDTEDPAAVEAAAASEASVDSAATAAQVSKGKKKNRNN